MRPISQISAVKLCLLGLATLATLALAGCASSNWSQTYDDTTGATAPRTRSASSPAAPVPRQATARHRPTDVSATAPVRDDADRRMARRSDVTSDAAPAPKPLSDEWLRLEDEKEDKLRRTMNICRGC